MFNTTPILELLGRAANACALQQAAHTANIANAGVEGYHRVEADFDSELARMQSAMSSGADGSWTAELAAQPTLVQSTDDSVKLDQEMALMAKNAVRYQALIGAFEKTTSLLRLAVKEGREG
jgi:flagellar basal-body rod protein FlgB